MSIYDGLTPVQAKAIEDGIDFVEDNGWYSTEGPYAHMEWTELAALLRRVVLQAADPPT